MPTHQLEIGAIKLTIIDDGMNAPSADSYVDMLGDIAADDVRKAAQGLYPDPAKFMGFSFNCLLIETDGTRILVDTGSGVNGLPEHGHVQRDVADPATIERVIITHLHGDHVNGLAQADGTPHYPNAEVVLSGVEWQHWMGDDGVISRDAARAKMLKHAFGAYEDKVTLIDFNQEVELAAGVTSLPAAGHTPGHIGLMIESQGERLLDVVDALHTGVQMPNPAWSVDFDTDKALAAATRKRLLKRAVDEELLTLIYHFEFPGLGYVRQAGDAFRWEAVSSA